MLSQRITIKIKNNYKTQVAVVPSETIDDKNNMGH